MITYHILRQKISKLKQLIAVIESSSGQSISLHRAVRNLEAAMREFPKAKDQDNIHNDVADEARNAQIVLQRFLHNMSMACYHFAERGRKDDFDACQVKLTRAVRIWQTENVGFTLSPDEPEFPADKKVKGLKSLFKKKAAK